MVNHTGVAAAIRQYLTDHPVSRLSAVATAIGFPLSHVGREARRMALRGILLREGRHRQYYRLGRALITHDPEVVKANDRKRCAAYKRRRRARLAALKPTKPPKLPKAKPVKPETRKTHERVMTDPRKALRQAITDTVNSAKEQPATKQQAETIEEWEARTGQHPERLPCTFVPPTAYGQFHGTMREQAGMHGSHSG